MAAVQPQPTPEQCSKLYTSEDKWKVSLLSGLIFLFMSSPYLYNIVNSVFSGVASPSGCPTSVGLIVMAGLFVLVVRLLMR